MKTKQGLKERINFWFEDMKTPMGKGVDIAIMILILISCMLFVALTFDLSENTRNILEIIDAIILILFTIEYVLRFWVAEKKVKHFFKIYSLIDLIVIIPLFFSVRLQFVRIFRLLRLFKLLRYLEHRHFFFGSITHSGLIITRIIFTIFAIVFVSSGLIYYFENPINPGVDSFFHATYFSFVAMTTVGFGDIVPISDTGRAITMLMILSGIIFIPWQVGSLIKHTFRQGHKVEYKCKSCGLKYHDKDASHCKACGKRIYIEYEGN